VNTVANTVNTERTKREGAAGHANEGVTPTQL
jgi:hypothetical protein